MSCASGWGTTGIVAQQATLTSPSLFLYSGRSSMVEHTAVDRGVAGSSPADQIGRVVQW